METTLEKAPRARASSAVSPVLLLLLSTACAASPPPPSAEPAPETQAEPIANPSDDEPAAPETAIDEASASDAASEAPPPDDKNETRDVVYKMVPGGLEIEVDGVKFTPKASPVKVAGGAWGVKITMDAESVGDAPRHLLKPKGGVLAFAGTVKRKGKEEKFGDRREGDESVELAAGASMSFESTWPKPGAKNALWYGNELLLDVGLWGFGKSADALRPVRQFFTLRMVAGNKPQPIIQPPKSAE